MSCYGMIFYEGMKLRKFS